MKRHPDDHLAEQFDGLAHVEKMAWMVETQGWALEPVEPRPELDRPRPGYAYTIGLPSLVAFPEVVVFGLTPVAANGLLGLVVDALRGGTEIPVGVELVGLLDNDLRCQFAPIVDHAEWFATGDAWYRGAAFDIVQLLYPDRNGFMPYEAGYDQRMRFAQPVIGRIDR